MFSMALHRISTDEIDGVLQEISSTRRLSGHIADNLDVFAEETLAKKQTSPTLSQRKSLGASPQKLPTMPLTDIAKESSDEIYNFSSASVVTSSPPTLMRPPSASCFFPRQAPTTGVSRQIPNWQSLEQMYRPVPAPPQRTVQLPAIEPEVLRPKGECVVVKLPLDAVLVVESYLTTSALKLTCSHFALLLFGKTVRKRITGDNDLLADQIVLFCNRYMTHVLSLTCRETEANLITTLLRGLSPVLSLSVVRLHFHGTAGRLYDPTAFFPLVDLVGLTTLEIQGPSASKSFCDSVINLLPQLTGMQSLHINLSHSAMDTEGLERLCAAINSLPGLRALRLFVGANTIKDISSLAAVLHQPNLQFTLMDIGGNPVTQSLLDFPGSLLNRAVTHRVKLYASGVTWPNNSYDLLAAFARLHELGITVTHDHPPKR
eukprot:TRINITY_DN1178_c0_g1_i1.p1 TRINITY_DN1178_c0_g1~~TRINITY_DN1178_c0_g1_i1.p1  ORF type:complete len:432 (+),score=56.26 TRINITY_DN1178_c0_g1_i1:1157-2452(+)